MSEYCTLKWFYYKLWAGAVKLCDVKAASEYKRLHDEHIQNCKKCREAAKETKAEEL